MAQFHFVEDYERWVETLIRQHPLDEAMSLAVGGSYEQFGIIELDILRHAGLGPGMCLLDMGCGSGRLAYALSRAGLGVRFIGVDVVQKLLDYAKLKTSAEYEFILHRRLDIPAADGSVDMLSAFSLFTHLLPAETYLYLQDAVRVLRPGGKVVFSFLELAAPTHWGQFVTAVEGVRSGTSSHLDMFIERGVIGLWAQKLGYDVLGYIEPEQAVAAHGCLGQSTAILQKP